MCWLCGDQEDNWHPNDEEEEEVPAGMFGGAMGMFSELGSGLGGALGSMTSMVGLSKPDEDLVKQQRLELEVCIPLCWVCCLTVCVGRL